MVAGTSDWHAVRYTPATGIADLGGIGGSVGAAAIAYRVSDDGIAIVGSAPDSFNHSQAFRWTQAGGMQNLGALASTSHSNAQGVSADGQVVVGQLNFAVGDRAFRWTAAGGFTNLGVLAGHTQSTATDVSADGSVVVGASGPFSAGRAFRWTAAGGMQNLGVLPGGSYSIAAAVSNGGSTVAGFGDSTASDPRAFVWSTAGGLHDIGVIPGGVNSRAEDISGDGTSVVGISHSSALGDRAFLWTADSGMVDLNVLLPTYGINLTGWQLTEAIGISADGLTIVGVGNFGNSTQGWVATIPDPGSLIVPAFAGVIALRRRRRQA